MKLPAVIRRTDFVTCWKTNEVPNLLVLHFDFRGLCCVSELQTSAGLQTNNVQPTPEPPVRWWWWWYTGGSQQAYLPIPGLWRLANLWFYQKSNSEGNNNFHLLLSKQTVFHAVTSIICCYVLSDEMWEDRWEWWTEMDMERTCNIMNVMLQQKKL